MVITIDTISEKAFADAAKQIEQYTRRFETKVKEFVKELLKAGIEVATQSLTGEGDSTPVDPDSTYVRMGVANGIMEAALRMRGEDVLFIEFGAGIHYNTPAGTSPHPWGVELGYTIGSYGKGYGAMDEWEYWEGGKKYTSQGTEAMMPMYNADMKIRATFVDIARRVFGGT